MFFHNILAHHMLIGGTFFSLFFCIDIVLAYLYDDLEKLKGKWPKICHWAMLVMILASWAQGPAIFIMFFQDVESVPFGMRVALSFALGIASGVAGIVAVFYTLWKSEGKRTLIKEEISQVKITIKENAT